MSDLVVRTDLVPGILSACALAGVPTPVTAPQATGSFLKALPNVTITWTPDLSPTDLATVQSIVKLAVGATLLSTDDRTAIEPFLVTGRTLLGMNQSTFTGQTQAQINRQVFDNLSGLWRVIFRLLRDS